MHPQIKMNELLGNSFLKAITCLVELLNFCIKNIDAPQKDKEKLVKCFKDNRIIK